MLINSCEMIWNNFGGDEHWSNKIKANSNGSSSSSTTIEKIVFSQVRE